MIAAPTGDGQNTFKWSIIFCKLRCDLYYRLNGFLNIIQINSDPTAFLRFFMSRSKCQGGNGSYRAKKKNTHPFLPKNSQTVIRNRKSGVKSREISFLHNLFLSNPIINAIFQRAQQYRYPTCITIMQVVSKTNGINLSPPSATYMRWWTGSALIQIMACRLDGTNPLSEPMLTISQLDPKKYISMKFYLKFKYFYSRKCVSTCRLGNGGHLTHCGLVTPYGGIDLGQHWLR